MIIWGGGDATKGFNDGARYDPVTDTWMPISGGCALSPRVHHVAVWAESSNAGDCGSATDSWKPISTQGVPMGRILTKAVWTGTELLLWGGVNDAQAQGVGNRSRYVGTGALYNPATDAWRDMVEDGAPSPRLTSGVWTGQKFLTFGGWNDRHLNDAYSYSP
jgi:hypothetical protein